MSDRESRTSEPSEGRLVGGADPTTIDDPHHMRQQPGDGRQVCADCGQGIVPGHAIEWTSDGRVHEDCTDKWFNFFEQPPASPADTSGGERR